MRRTLALLGAVGLAYVAAHVLGEYELTLGTALAGGFVVGAAEAEVMLTVGRWHGPVPAVAMAVAAGTALWWAAWIDAGHGLEPLKATAWPGIAVAALVAAGRLWRSPRGAG